MDLQSIPKKRLCFLKKEYMYQSFSKISVFNKNLDTFHFTVSVPGNVMLLELIVVRVCCIVCCMYGCML